MAKKILIVEHDAAVVDALSHEFQREGYEVVLAREIREGLRKTQMLCPDLVLLDVMLPDVDGLEVCREIRASSAAHIPIVMLTARAEEADELHGFLAGADDYVVKPFFVKVLLQRIKVLLRRPLPRRKEVLESAGVRIDQRGHQVMVHNQPIPLTPAEFRILETLLRHPGRAFTRRDLKDSPVGNATIDVQINSLRRKLGDAGQRIETVRGIGYRFQEGGSA